MISSNSFEENSQDSFNDNANNQMNNLNSQYLRVRRPNEDNVLEFFNFQEVGVPNTQPQRSEFSPPPKLHKKSQSLSFDDDDFHLIQQNNEISQKMLERVSINEKSFTQKAQNSTLLQRLRYQLYNPIPKNNIQYLDKLNDLSSGISISQRVNFENLKIIINATQLICNILLYFESSIQLTFFIDERIFNLSFYIITLLINLVDLKLQKISVQIICIHLMNIILIICYMIYNKSLISIGFIINLNIIRDKYIYLNQQQIRYHYYPFFKIFEYIFKLFIITHISGCLFYLICKTDQNSWIYYEEYSWQYKYLLVFNWALSTITTLGQSQIHLSTTIELISTQILLFIMISLLIYTIMFTNNDQEKLIYNQLTKIQHYFHKRNIPITEIKKGFIYLINKLEVSEQKLQEENQLLSLLPYQFSKFIHFSLYYQNLLKIPFFQYLSDVCIHDLAMGMRELVFPQEFSVGNEGLHIILEGYLKVLLPNDALLLELGPGSIVGQEQLFLNKPQHLKFVTASKIRLGYLSENRFFETLIKHPKDYQIYRMLLDSKQLDIGSKCFVCDEKQHTTIECPQVHLVLDKFDIIIQHLQSEKHERVKMQRNSRRTTNARFGQKLFEDNASMFQEIQYSVAEPTYSNKLRKQSKSLNSEDSKQQLKSQHSISAIAKPQGSALSSSTYNVFNDVQRKISKQYQQQPQQDSEKVSNHSIQKHHKSSQNSFKDTPYIYDERLLDDSVILAIEKRRKSSIGRIQSLRLSPTTNKANDLPSVSEIQTDEEATLLHQYSANSSRKFSPSIKARGTLQGSTGEDKQFQLIQELDIEDVFDKPMTENSIYFPDYNMYRVIEKLGT